MVDAGLTPEKVLAPHHFITFEGGEGGGKSTQIKLLAEALEKAGKNVLLTREPGGAVGAEDIRRLLVQGEPGRWTAETEVLLHFAARADHLERTIRPALADGKWVLCDRFVDSTLAYQGYGHRFDLEWLQELRRRVVRWTEPRRTFILDLPHEVGLTRAASRMTSSTGRPVEDRYERMDRGFHRRLEEGFRQIASDEPDRCVLINANRPIDVVASEIRSSVEKLYQIKLS